MEIRTDGKYQTRDGRAVRLHKRLLHEDYPVIGSVYIHCGAGWLKTAWTSDGVNSVDGTGATDLVPIMARHERWVVICRGGRMAFFKTEREAIAGAGDYPEAVAIRCLDWEE